MHRVVRKDEILDILHRYNFVTVKFLAEALYVSPSSIRRDLAVLEGMGLVKRTHGGVSEIDSGKALSPYSMRMQNNVADKRNICRKAAELIADGDIIFIDGSTTCLFLPELIEEKNDITVLTNSLRLASMFKKNNVKVYCTGGSVRLYDEFVASGPIAEESCRNIHTNIMFFSARAIDENGVIYDLNEPETELRKVALRNTDKAVFLCDFSKFNKKSTFKVCDADELHCIITNEAVSEETKNNLRVKEILY